MLDHNADINIRSDSDGATPLMRLCETEGYTDNHLESAKVLVERGADINVEDINGCTALHRAFSGGHAVLAQVRFGLVDANGVGV